MALDAGDANAVNGIQQAELKAFMQRVEGKIIKQKSTFEERSWNVHIDAWFGLRVTGYYEKQGEQGEPGYERIREALRARYLEKLEMRKAWDKKEQEQQE